MELFLDSFQLRKLQLLNILDSEGRFFSISELSLLLNVSAPTIDKTIEAVKNDCQLYQLPLRFERKNNPFRGVAVYRTIPIERKIISLRKRYIKESLQYRLLDELFFEQFIDIKTFAKEQYMSNSIIYQKLGKLRVLLTRFDLTLELGKSFKLIGKESQIRFLFVSLFWETYDDYEWPLTIDKHQMDKILNEIECFIGVSISPPKREYYRLWLGVCWIRIEKGYRISSMITDDLRKLSNQHHRVIELKNCFKQFVPDRIDQAIIDEEFSFLLLIIYSFDIRNNYQRVPNSPHLEIINQLTKDELESQAEYFLSEISTNLKERFMSEDFDHFYLNVLNIMLRHFYLLGGVRHFLPREFIFKNPSEEFFYDYVKRTFQMNQTKSPSNNSLIENDNFYMEVSLFLFSSLRKRRYLPKLHFLVLCYHPDNLLYLEVNKQLPFYEIVYYSDLSERGSFDLIISADIYERISNISCEKVIYINPFYGEKDLLNIKEVTENIYVNKLQTLFN